MLRKLTRREAAKFLTEKGYPTSRHTLNRLCAPAVNQGPPPVGKWGNRELFTEPVLLEWAEERSAITERADQPTTAEKSAVEKPPLADRDVEHPRVLTKRHTTPS